MANNPRNVGAQLTTNTQVEPQTVGAGTTDGTGFERMPDQSQDGLLSCVFAVSVGAGTVNGTDSIDAVIQHSSDDGATDAYTDYTDPSTGQPAAITTVEAASTTETVNVDLSAAEQFVRAHLTGNAAYSAETAAWFTFGGSALKPPGV